jgi:hypothetical protein
MKYLVVLLMLSAPAFGNEPSEASSPKPSPSIETASPETSTHSGRTDKSGCHHDRKNGGYHCH